MNSAYQRPPVAKWMAMSCNAVAQLALLAGLALVLAACNNNPPTPTESASSPDSAQAASSAKTTTNGATPGLNPPTSTQVKERGTADGMASETENEKNDVTAATTAPGQSGTSASNAFGIVLTDVTLASKIDFEHWYDGGGELLIVEPVAAGMASLDFDRDGLIDLYFLNGAAIPYDSARTAANGLYHNLGGMQFEKVTEAASADDRRHSLGVGVADYDGDGFPDLYINNFGRNNLLRNNGDGTFSDWTDAAKVGGGERLGAGVCFFDADGDGLLDLYVGNYVKSPVESNVKRTTDGFPSYPGPLDFEPDVDTFYRNEGDGTFSDQSESSGIGLVPTTSMGAIAGDFDEDGDIDLIVGNDVDRNTYFLNDGTGKFEEIGIQAGVAFSYDGQRNGNMGIDCADYNLDGFLDLYTTTFSNDLPVLYRNDGAGNFEDVTQAANAGDGLIPHANWGTSFVDLENDGDKDLVIANGHTSPNVNRWAFNTAWKVANTVLLNDGRGKFKNISSSCGSGLAPVESSRGLVTEDLDNDGDVDIAILNALAPATIIRNDSEGTGNWLQLELVGTTACRDAVGARVRFELDGRPFVDEVRSGRGYQSSYGQRLYFGLGQSALIPTLTIRWPDGSQQVLTDVRANQLLTIVQPATP